MFLIRQKSIIAGAKVIHNYIQSVLKENEATWDLSSATP